MIIRFFFHSIMGREENGKKERGREGGKARQGERERERERESVSII